MDLKIEFACNEFCDVDVFSIFPALHRKDVEGVCKKHSIDLNRIRKLKVSGEVTHLMTDEERPITIGEEVGTFQNCMLLQHVTLGPKVRYIGPHSFSGCRNLHTILIKNEEAELDPSSFGGDSSGLCVNLKSIAVGTSEPFSINEFISGKIKKKEKMNSDMLSFSLDSTREIMQ